MYGLEAQPEDSKKENCQISAYLLSLRRKQYNKNTYINPMSVNFKIPLAASI